MCDNWKRVCQLEKVHHCRLWKIYQLSVVRFPNWLELVRICKPDELGRHLLHPTLSLPTGTIWRLALWEALQRHRLLEGRPDGVPGVPGRNHTSGIQVRPKVAGHLGGRRWGRWGQLQMLKWLRSRRWRWHSLHVSCCTIPYSFFSAILSPGVVLCGVLLSGALRRQWCAGSRRRATQPSLTTTRSSGSGLCWWRPMLLQYGLNLICNRFLCCDLPPAKMN